MELSVTQENIDAARAAYRASMHVTAPADINWSCVCPIAQALCQQFGVTPEMVHVDPSHTTVRVGERQFANTAAMVAFEDRFDLTWENRRVVIEPTTFELVVVAY